MVDSSGKNSLISGKKNNELESQNITKLLHQIPNTVLIQQADVTNHHRSSFAKKSIASVR